ncbi:hypothetical protein BLNAU_23962 [Blattamonas nauphoetae]|uniref:Uncharacterized protein n=1 Tax=Blattamonas nauphoetae TaxID=2049346 RepID=A0ABQ9WSY0_9EUKA|nr:hypothetical protein BLNAU_23962 [Blattamonas nauphoetae]
MAADGIIHRFISSEEAISIDTPVPQAIYDEGSLSISSYRGGYIGKTMKQFSPALLLADSRTSILRCTGVWPGGLQFGPEPMLVSTGLEFETVRGGSIKYELDNQNRSLNRQFPQDDPQPRPQALIDKMTPANK